MDDGRSSGAPQTVAVDFLGNIIWGFPLSPRTTPDVLIWDHHGPQRVRGEGCKAEKLGPWDL